MDTRIEYTPKDLEGHFVNNYDCPICRAVKRTFNIENVMVDTDYVYLVKGKQNIKAYEILDFAGHVLAVYEAKDNGHGSFVLRKIDNENDN